MIGKFNDVVAWDHTNINLTGAIGITYWTKVLDVSAEELHNAVLHAGTHVDAVRQFLSSRQLSLELSL